MSPQSTNHVLLVKPAEFYSNEQTIETNHYQNTNNKKPKRSNHFAEYLEEIKSILNSLGFLDSEIKSSIEFLTKNEKENTLLINSLSTEAKTALMDKHLKKILIRLSEKNT